MADRRWEHPAHEKKQSSLHEMRIAGKRIRLDGILVLFLGLVVQTWPVVIFPIANALTFFPPVSSRSNLTRTLVSRPQIPPPPSLLATTASGDTPDDTRKTHLRNSNQSVLSRILSNLLFGLTSPFPDLRNVLRIRKQQSDENTTDVQLVISWPLRSALVAITAYLSVGILAYHVLFEKWSIVDALYFSCVCLSTVGYGDLCPSTVAGKIFTCLFGFTGVALLGAAVANIGSKMVQFEVDAVQRVQRESRRRILTAYDTLPKLIHIKKRVKAGGGKRGRIDKMQVVEQVKHEKLLHNTTAVDFPSGRSLAVTFLLTTLKGLFKSSVVIASGGLIIGKLEGWSLFDSIYYSLVTAFTIGLGDLSPKTRAGRLVAIFLIPIFIAAAGEVLAGIGNTLVEQRQKKIFSSQIQKGATN